MSDTPPMTLNDGHVMPQLGFGTWQIPNGDAASVVAQAIATGYRAVDTAAVYGNEAGVGEALAGRPDIFVTTKLWNPEQGYDKTLRAASASLAKLRIDALDLYLIHWPVPRQDLYVETWRAFIELRRQGKARSIGVSNFAVEHLRRLFDETGVVPAVNQIELHPRFQQQALRTFHKTHGIVTQSWSPLGQGRLIAEPTILALADKHRRTPAQIVLRWHIDSGLNVIPKSVTPARIAENAKVFDFALDEDDMRRIAALDDPRGRIGPDPAAGG